MHYVYLLLLNNNAIYKGKTCNLKRRLAEHTNGHIASTKNLRPLKLIYYESYLNKKDADARELYLKSGRGRHEIKKQLKHTIQGMASSSSG
jgi:putative endonuclease